MEEKSEQQKQPEYKEKEFWNLRYQSNKDQFYDWYLSYKEMKDIFMNHLNIDKDVKFLNVGCGNSKSIFDMCKDGFENTVNVDYSDIVIQKMQQYAIDQGIQDKLQFEEQDCTAMKYEDKSFDIVFDKGTLDALVCGGTVKPLLQEMSRVMKDDGQLLIVSYGHPSERKQLFEECLGFENFEFRVKKQNLSQMALLVNLMRASTNAPLSELMKDKVQFLCVLMQYQKIQAELNKEQQKFDEVNWDLKFEENEEEQNQDQEQQSQDLGQQKQDEQKQDEQQEQGQKQDEQQKQDQDQQQEQQEEKQDQDEQQEQDEDDEQQDEGLRLGQEKNKHRQQHYCFVYQIIRKKL